jgi:hypothetical protein
MGGSSYSSSLRFARSTSEGYHTKSVNEIFTQNVKRVIHESMDPKGVVIREARDSENHPFSIPIIIALDFTGSMGHIPHELVKDGLPKIMSGIIEHGIADPQVLFLGIGDHECDRAPLQISQFESGDAELDMWLTRSFIEGGGGGNGGESYSLAHYFAANHTVTDHWEKRGQKGFLFTIGDEPNLRAYPSRALQEITGNGDVSTFTDAEILAKAQEKWNVYHILPGKETRGATAYWRELLGDKAIWIDSSNKVADTIRDIVCANAPKEALNYSVSSTTSTPDVITENTSVAHDTDTTSGDATKPNIML